MPRGLSDPTDVPLFAGLVRWILWLGEPTSECAGAGQRAVAGANSNPPCRPRWRRGEPTHLGGPPLRRGAMRTPPSSALDAPGGTVRGATAAAMAEETLRGASLWDTESSEPRLQGHGPQHQMGDRYHLYSHG